MCCRRFASRGRRPWIWRRWASIAARRLEQAESSRLSEDLKAAYAPRCFRWTPAQPVFVEAESRKIGAIHLPQPLLSAMRNAPMFFLRAEAEARARRLVADYPAMREHAPFAAAVEAIGGYVGGRQKEEWLRQHAAGEWESLAASLLSFYDAGYQKSLAANYANIAAEVAVVPDSINSIQTAAKEIQNSACLENGGG